MTGGRRRYSEGELCAFERQRERERERCRRLELSTDEQSLDAVIAAWLRAARFRRLAQVGLREQDLTFAQWRVLSAIDRLVREKEDAVSQLELATRTEMDANTTSAVVGKLMKKGLVSFDLDAWGSAYRLLLSDAGEAALGKGRQVVLRAADGLR